MTRPNENRMQTKTIDGGLRTTPLGPPERFYALTTRRSRSSHMKGSKFQFPRNFRNFFRMSVLTVSRDCPFVQQKTSHWGSFDLGDTMASIFKRGAKPPEEPAILRFHRSAHLDVMRVGRDGSRIAGRPRSESDRGSLAGSSRSRTGWHSDDGEGVCQC